MVDDLELLDAWRDGDKSAADALIKRHFTTLRRFFRNKADRGIEDLIQQTLLTCVERRDRFPAEWSFRTFLFVVARDQLYLRYRTASRGADFDPHVTSLADIDPSPSNVVAERDEQRLLLEALRRIPLELQLALELHYWEELSGPQLARVLGVPEGTVRSRLRRAKQLLAGKMVELRAGAPRGEPGVEDLAMLDEWAASVRGQLG